MDSLTEKENFYRSYFQMFLGVAVCFGVLSIWFADLGQTISYIACDAIVLICLFMTVICYHSYKETGRYRKQVEGDENGEKV